MVSILKMRLLAFKTYAYHQRRKIGETSGLSGRQLTQLLVQMWRDMSGKERFEWELLRAREKYLKKERDRFTVDLQDLLQEQEQSPDQESRMLRTEDIFRYLVTPAAMRVVETYPELHLAIRNKLLEFNELGVEAAPRWATALGIDLRRPQTGV